MLNAHATASSCHHQQLRPGCGCRYKNYDFLLGRLHECVSGGGRLVVVTDSKKTAIEIHFGLQHRFPDKRLLLYTGDTDAETKRRDFADVNASWAAADAVIYTSTCEAGISCTISGFEDVFAFHVGDVIGVQPFLQMVGRNRAVKRLHVYISENSKDGEVCEAPLTREGIFKEYKCVPRALWLLLAVLLLVFSF